MQGFKPLTAVMAAALQCSVVAAYAQDSFPAGQTPIKIVVGTPAGGGIDNLTRVVANRLSSQLNVPVVVENKGGANGAIAGTSVAKARPDGYTLLVGTIGNISLVPAAIEKPPYMPNEDLVAISPIASNAFLLFTAASADRKLATDFMGSIKGGGQSLASAGASVQLTIHAFKQKTKVELAHLNYRNTPEVIQSVMSNSATYGFSDFGPASALVKSGALRPIAVSSDERQPSMPEIPTTKEAGLPDLTLRSWIGLFAPAGTSPAIVERLNREMGKVLADPDTVAKIQNIEFIKWHAPAREFQTWVSSDVRRWTEMAKAADFKY